MSTPATTHLACDAAAPRGVTHSCDSTGGHGARPHIPGREGGCKFRKKVLRARARPPARLAPAGRAYHARLTSVSIPWIRHTTLLPPQPVAPGSARACWRVGDEGDGCPHTSELSQSSLSRPARTVRYSSPVSALLPHLAHALAVSADLRRRSLATVQTRNIYLSPGSTARHATAGPRHYVNRH